MIYKLLAEGRKPVETNSCAEASKAFDAAYNAGYPCVLYVDGVAVMRGNKFDPVENREEN